MSNNQVSEIEKNKIALEMIKIFKLYAASIKTTGLNITKSYLKEGIEKFADKIDITESFDENIELMRKEIGEE